MYKILIADDEDLIRTGLCKNVPWNEWGYEVAGLAKDGHEVLSLLSKTSPDVILTDIKMPKMNGLELAKVIQENYENIKVVILSGYNENVYLHEAIKNRVVAYLNKPTDYDEFENEFQKLKGTLDSEREVLKERETLRDYLNESLPFMREFFFFDILSGRIADDIKRKLDFYNINVPAPDFYIVLIELDNYYKLLKTQNPEKVYLLMQIIIYLASNIFKLKNFFYEKNINSVVGICPCEKISENLAELQKEFFSLEKLTISASISSPAKSIYDIPSKWEEVIQAVRQKVFFGNEAIIFYDDISEFQTFSSTDIRSEITRIIDVVFYKDVDYIEQELAKFFGKLEGRLENNYEYIDKICLEILFDLEKSVGTHRVTLNKFLSSVSKSIFDIFKFDNIYEKTRWVTDIFIGFSQSAISERKGKINTISKEAKSYIEKNYMNNSISLEQVADAVGKNPAYLSNLFKGETGQNFSDYVRNLRIERAKELLNNNNLKVYEIAAMVGYADVSNFTKVFKKSTGISPGEYRSVSGDTDEES